MGEYHAGHLLLFGGPGIPKEQAVSPNPAEGLQWTFRAATNFYPRALYDMSQALQSGLGTGANMVEAYAWLQLYANSSEGGPVGRVYLNQLALKLDTATIRQGQQLAEEFKSGHWPQPPAKNVVTDAGLKLNGIISGSAPLATINGRTMAIGETTKLTLNSESVTLKCLKIEPAAVLIQIDGEAAPRRLTLQ